MSPYVLAQQPRIKLLLDRYMRSHFSDLEALAQLKTWIRENSTTNFSGTPFKDNLEWMGESHNTPLNPGPLGGSKGCVLLRKRIFKGAQRKGKNLTLSLYITEGSNCGSTREYLEYINASFSQTLSRIAELLDAPEEGHYACCMIYVSDLALEYERKKDDSTDFYQVFTSCADLIEKQFPKGCACSRVARTRANEAIVGRAARKPSRPQPTGPKRLLDLQQARRPKPQKFRSPVTRDPGAGLSPDMRAAVDRAIEALRTGATFVELPTGGVALPVDGSLNRRLWLLGRAALHAMSDPVSALIAERIWCAFQEQVLAPESSGDVDARYRRRRLGAAARLQSRVDPDATDPGAMLRLLNAADPSGEIEPASSWRAAYERGAAGLGWDIGAMNKPPDPAGESLLRRAAAFGSARAAALLGEAILEGIAEPLDTSEAQRLLMAGHRGGSAHAARVLAGAIERGRVGPRRLGDAQSLRRGAFARDMGAALAGDRGAMIQVARALRDGGYLSIAEAWATTVRARTGLTSTETPIARGAELAMIWLLRAAGSKAPFSRSPIEEDFPEDLDVTASMALVEIAQLLDGVMGGRAEAHDTAIRLLALASKAGYGESTYRLAEADWRAWPDSEDRFETPLGVYEDAKLSEIATRLGLAVKQGYDGAAPLLWHIAHLETFAAGPDRFAPHLDDEGHRAYRAALDGSSTWRRVYRLALMTCGPRTPDPGRAAEVRRLWDLEAGEGSQVAPAARRLFEDPGRLEGLLAFDPAKVGLLGTPTESGAKEALFATQHAARAWLDRQSSVPLAAADWLDSRSRLADVFQEPGRAAWGRCAARAQLRVDGQAGRIGFGAQSAKEIDASISRATAATGPLGLRLDERGVPVPGARAPDRRWQRRPWWQRAMPAAAFSEITAIHLRPNARLFPIQIAGNRDDRAGLVSAHDVEVILALNLLERLETRDPERGAGVSLSLEPPEPITQAHQQWRLLKREFRPAWLGATDFGRALYISDYWLWLEASGSSLFSLTEPLDTAGDKSRFVVPQPWRRAAAAGGITGPYVRGMLQLHLAARHRSAAAEALTGEGTTDLLINIPKVSARVYGAGMSLDDPDSEPRRNVDDRFWRNYYMRTAALLSEDFVTAGNTLPVLERAALLMGIYAEVAAKCRGIQIAPGSSLHRRLMGVRSRAVREWSEETNGRGFDLVWAAGAM